MSIRRSKELLWAVCLFGLLAATVSQIAISQEKAARVDQPAGDPVRGQVIFAGKGGCTSCHRVGETGSTLGPNLTDIATQLTVEQMRKSLVSPNPEVSSSYRRYRVTTRSGKVITGRLLNQDPYSLQMVDSENQLVAVARSELRSWGFVQTAPMPSYRETLDAGERDDVVAYLASLTGVVPR
jgi:putative heme-binding domain-containing protein